MSRFKFVGRDRSGIAAVTLVLTVAACTGLTPALDNTDWQLERGPGLETGHDQSVQPVNLHIEQRQVWGFAGCNQFSAGYTVDNGYLKVRDLRVTRKACENPGRQQLEQALLTALERGGQSVRNGERLNFQTANGTFEFVRRNR